MVTVKLLHCSQRKNWLHSSMVRNYKKISKYNNQQWWWSGSKILRWRADSARRLNSCGILRRWCCCLHWKYVTMILWLNTCYVRSDPNDARSCRSFSLLAISARRRSIIDPSQFLMGGPPAERRGNRGVVPPVEKEGIKVWCQCKIIRHRQCSCYCRGKF